MTDSVPNKDDLEGASADEIPSEPTTEEHDSVDVDQELLDDIVTELEEDLGLEESPPAEEAAEEGEEDVPSMDAADEGEETEELDVADDGEGDEDSELETARRDFEELNDRHLRLAAEFNNFRRRTEQERLEMWSRAQADMVAKFLDVLDDLHRVAELDLENATVDAIMEGIDLVETKFRRVLEDNGVEMIDPVGHAFDPEIMEAMMRVPTDDEGQDDVVAAVFQKGYSLKGILVRPARVSVHKHG